MTQASANGNEAPPLPTDLTAIMPMLRERFGNLLAAEDAILKLIIRLNDALMGGRQARRELDDLEAAVQRHASCHGELIKLAVVIADILADRSPRLVAGRPPEGALRGLADNRSYLTKRGAWDQEPEHHKGATKLLQPAGSRRRKLLIYCPVFGV